MKDIFERLKLLIIKLISVKGLIWIIATVLIFLKILTVWMWFSISILFVSTRMFEKLIGKLPDKENKEN